MSCTGETTRSSVRSPLLRKSLVAAAAAAAGALTALSVVPAHAAEYSSALKIRGVQYDAPGRDSDSCSSGNTVKLRGGHGTGSDTHNVVYRDNCNFLWNNDKDAISLYKPSGSRADVHTYTKSSSDPDGNGYISFT